VLPFICGHIARALARTPATPSLLTGIAMLAGLGAGGLLAAGWNVVAGAAIVATIVVGATRGELASLRGGATRFGAVFEAVAERYADAAILGGMVVRAVRFEDWPQPEAVGMAALAGALTVAYAGARIRASLGDRPRTGEAWFGGRDVQLAVAAVGALAGQCYWALAALGALSAAAVAWRLGYLRVRRIGLEP